MNDISKEQFDVVYIKHQPNKWIKFIYNNFSEQNENKKLTLNNFFVYILFFLFLFGFFETILNLSKTLLIIIINCIKKFKKVY